MFSQLGPLFRTAFRQAEQSDARFEIRREEKQGQGKRHEAEDDAPETSDLWDDSTTVSIEALKTFLLEFLKSKGEETSATAQGAGDVTAPAYTPPPLKPATTIAARAMKAYASHAIPESSPPPAPQTTEAVDLASLLQADELRTMHVLIGELDQLSARGVQTLTIEKEDTFLGALVTAVQRARTGG